MLTFSGLRTLKVMKFCSSCKQNKSLDRFNKNRHRKDGLQSTCRDCNRRSSKDYYASNKAHHRQVIKNRNQKLRKENRQRLCDYLRSHPCVDCEESDIVVLDFDHLRDKSFNISTMIDGHSWDKILAEIAKCDVVCANCHRRRTGQRTNCYRLSD